MSDDDRFARLTRLRREPPPLNPVVVADRIELSPRLIRLTFEGDGLCELVVAEPAASVRLLVPAPGTDDLVIPDWDGNEFLLPDGSRPALRTFTPLRVDNDAGQLDLEVVRHPGGAVSNWAEAVAPGAPAAISGPGSGYRFRDGVERLIVFADETAIPAVTDLLAAAPPELSLDVHVEAVTDNAQIDLDLRLGDSVEWHVTQRSELPGGRIVEAVGELEGLPDGTDIWAAGEASAMHAIRTHLFDALALERKRATVRGYWKPAR